MNIIAVTKKKSGGNIEFKDKQHEMMFMTALWWQLLYLDDALKKHDVDSELRKSVRACKVRCLYRMQDFKSEVNKMIFGIFL